jgi:phytoene/squalene synthetase
LDWHLSLLILPSSAPCLAAAAASSGLESASYARAEVLSNHMGLFLQKTNIIRDYLVRA